MAPSHRYLVSAVLGGAAMFLAGSTRSIVAEPQPVSNAKVLFDKRCGGCHALDRDQEGPRLGGVYGRIAGTVKSFSYSVALKEFRITWNEESLDKWLTNPEQLVPNNDMAFRLEKVEERRIIISFLRENSPQKPRRPGLGLNEAGSFASAELSAEGRSRVRPTEAPGNLANEICLQQQK
jgi:cytochrome c